MATPLAYTPVESIEGVSLRFSSLRTPGAGMMEFIVAAVERTIKREEGGGTLFLHSLTMNPIDP